MAERSDPDAIVAQRLTIRGRVQGVGFRPFVHRLATEEGLRGSVGNTPEGVRILAEGPAGALARFRQRLESEPPPAARIAEIRTEPANPRSAERFEIVGSVAEAGSPVARIAPDLPVCNACLRELFDPTDRRYRYPYINCTDCGPRYSIVLSLPYDRPATTMCDWPMCDDCAAEYRDPANRRFHAQPIACHACGPQYVLRGPDGETRGDESTRRAAGLLREGRVVAIKGLGGYHLACDATNADAVAALRRRKFRKEKPFALMTRDLTAAKRLVHITQDVERVLCSTARPIALARARTVLAGVAPGNADLGVMLPYTPLQHLLFADGSPAALVMTSGNRSSEPIAYRDDDAAERLGGIADALLVGERPIARAVEDSVVCMVRGVASTPRRARGYAPEVVATLPSREPLLAVGGDLKNSVTLVVDGQAVMSPFLGDLEQLDAREASRSAVRDLLEVYEIDPAWLTVAYDTHPDYASSRFALELPARRHVGVQHHHAHVASVLAEHGEFETDVVGLALDGTGFGDDGAIWGGELLIGSVASGFRRGGHLRYAAMPGGDAAARFPVQAAAGFLGTLDDLPDLRAEPFRFPERFFQAVALARSGLRTVPTSSVGRLFDTVAALSGFDREISFEGQAAIWLEQLARRGRATRDYGFPVCAGQLDWRPALLAIVGDRAAGEAVEDIAASFHRGLAHGLAFFAAALAEANSTRIVVGSGGVFQNALLVAHLEGSLRERGFVLWTPGQIPCNDGGLSLGQAALAAAAGFRESR